MPIAHSAVQDLSDLVRTGRVEEVAGSRYLSSSVNRYINRLESILSQLDKEQRQAARKQKEEAKKR